MSVIYTYPHFIHTRIVIKKTGLAILSHFYEKVFMKDGDHIPRCNCFQDNGVKIDPVYIV